MSFVYCCDSVLHPCSTNCVAFFRPTERRAAFKKTVDNSDGRRRREETTRQIRKNKKEEQLRKRRMGMAQSEEMVTASGNQTPENNATKRVTVEDIPKLKTLLLSSTASMEETIEATRGFRRILSAERDPPVDDILAAGVLPYLVKNLVLNPQAATLIFESAWALTNIASTTKTRVVVEAGAVEPLIQLLRHENPDVRDQAAWCLGNIAGDKQEYRDLLLYSGVIEPLYLNLTQPASMPLLGNVTWTVSNLCRGKPAPDMSYLESIISPLHQILLQPTSVEVMVDAVWALSYLSDGPNDRIERVMTTGVTTKLVEFLNDKSSPLLTPTIRCLGNFVTGSDVQTQAVVDAGIIQHLHDLLEHPRVSCRRFAGLAFHLSSQLRTNYLPCFFAVHCTHPAYHSQGDLLAGIKYCRWYQPTNHIFDAGDSLHGQARGYRTSVHLGNEKGSVVDAFQYLHYRQRRSCKVSNAASWLAASGRCAES